MPLPIIEVDRLSKQYHIGAIGASSLQEAGEMLWKKAFCKSGKPQAEDTIWAVKDVSFSVNEGEIIGIIGRNGAGKSTLLKILSRITEPTSGRAILRGRVASLLEVGTGFHRELTGRENIYLNGAILGMRKSEIDRKFDEIVAFAEVEKFIDTPVKHYSSGMYVRLAFAVAAHLEPEILLVDEVLAVGDAVFQKKCLGKIGDIAKGGRTVLFVSHNMMAVQALCYQAVFLEQGNITERGATKKVIDLYLKKSFSSQLFRMFENVSDAPGNSKVKIRSALVRPLDGQAGDPITLHTSVVIEFEYWNLKSDTQLHLTVHLYNKHGIAVFDSGPVDEKIWNGKPFPKGLFRSVCQIPGDLLNDGTYRVKLFIVELKTKVLSQHDDILVFDVLDDPAMRGHWFGEWLGVIRPRLKWETILLNEKLP